MHNQDRPVTRRLDPSLLLAVLLFFLLAAISQADTDRNHGLLWEISKPGIPPSYLFGTIHSEDPAVVICLRRFNRPSPSPARLCSNC